jgi:hypothetical protein
VLGFPLEPDRNQRRELASEVLEFLDEWLDRRSADPTP